MTCHAMPRRVCVCVLQYGWLFWLLPKPYDQVISDVRIIQHPRHIHAERDRDRRQKNIESAANIRSGFLANYSTKQAVWFYYLIFVLTMRRPVRLRNLARKTHDKESISQKPPVPPSMIGAFTFNIFQMRYSYASQPRHETPPYPAQQ